MKFKYKNLRAISDQNALEDLREHFRKSDLLYVYETSVSNTMIEGAEEGFTDTEILCSRAWDECSPVRKAALCHLLEQMVASGLVRWVKVRTTKDGQKVYKTSHPIDAKYWNSIY